MSLPQAFQFTSVAIGNRAILIKGPSGSGKSTLALELIERGADLIGDDSVLLIMEHDRITALPHPKTRGLLEVRNLGLLPFPCLNKAKVALVLSLSTEAPRYIEGPSQISLLGITLPHIEITPHCHGQALKAELALTHYGSDE